MLKLVSNLVPHILISIISILIHATQTTLSINFSYFVIFHLWYYICFSHIPIFKVKRSLSIKILHSILFIPFWILSQKYCDSLIYYVSYIVLYISFLNIKHSKYTKSNPDILCINQSFLKEWPNIIGYRVIGELIFENTENIQKYIKQADPNAILWSAKSGSEFVKVLKFCLDQGICINIFKNNEIEFPSISNCLEELSEKPLIKKQKFILYGDNIAILHQIFLSLKDRNEVLVLMNRNTPLSKKMFYKKIFNGNLIYKLEKTLQKDNYQFIHLSGLISFDAKDKNVDFLHDLENISKLCQQYKSSFMFLSSQNYETKSHTTHEMICASENIVKKSSGIVLKFPYIAIDYKYNLYNSKFYKKFIANKNISNSGSWISINSLINYIFQNLNKKEISNIHGAFLTKKEIYNSLNLIQRSWNIWPKKLDYIRGHKICNHPINQNL